MIFKEEMFIFFSKKTNEGPNTKELNTNGGILEWLLDERFDLYLKSIMVGSYILPSEG